MFGIYYFRGNCNGLDYICDLESEFRVNTRAYEGEKENKLYYIFKRKNKSSYGKEYDYLMERCDVNSFKGLLIKIFGKNFKKK